MGPFRRRYVREPDPAPSTCSLTVELGSHPRPELPHGHTVVVTGVVTRRFDVEVRGWGRVAGVKFRPGGLAELTGRPASAWTDRVVPGETLLPTELCAALANPDDEGYAGTLADLAHRYGWYDQAHFTRDFTALVGVTPGQYRDRPGGQTGVS